MERKIKFSEGEYYHVYNRGVDRRTIFTKHPDYKRFLRMLYLCNSTKSVIYRDVQNLPLCKIKRGEQLVAIGAYCLMPNHFHLLLTPLVENGISQFILKLQTGYSSYFNKKHERKGSLVEQKFRASHADTDEYLKYLYAYIHLNPAKIKEPKWKEKGASDLKSLREFTECYAYSSIGEYKTQNFEIVSPKNFPGYFPSAHDFQTLTNFWLSYQPLT